MSRTPSKALRLLLVATVLSSCIGCDQATKKIATRSLRGRPAQSYLGDTVRLEYALNPGGFLSLGGNLPNSTRNWLFIGLNMVFMLLLVGFLLLRWNISLLVFVSLSYVLAGGIGNLIDRATQGGMVIDFMNVGVGPIRSGVFNAADIALFFGALAVMICARGRSDVRRRRTPESFA